MTPLSPNLWVLGPVFSLGHEILWVKKVVNFDLRRSLKKSKSRGVAPSINLLDQMLKDLEIEELDR